MGSERELKKVVDKLFRNGFGQEAERLVLTSADGRDLGGWCKKAVLDQLIAAWNNRAGEGENTHDER